MIHYHCHSWFLFNRLYNIILYCCYIPNSHCLYHFYFTLISIPCFILYNQFHFIYLSQLFNFPLFPILLSFHHLCFVMFLSYWCSFIFGTFYVICLYWFRLLLLMMYPIVFHAFIHSYSSFIWLSFSQCFDVHLHPYCLSNFLFHWYVHWCILYFVSITFVILVNPNHLLYSH